MLKESSWPWVFFCGLLLCLLAWTVRLAVVGEHRLHPDEALYGHHGLMILSGRDRWLATMSVRKPPLLPYLLAGSLALLGRLEWAVRLPGLIASMAAVGLTGRLALRLYRDPQAALTAMAVVALSPLAFLFTVGRTDPVMVALGLAGCVVAAEGRPGWAGLLTGLSFATKRTGVVWLPLVGLLSIVSLVRPSAPRVSSRAGRRAVLGLVWGVAGFLVVVGLVLAWDQVRVAQGAESFWRAGVVGYGGLRLAQPAEQAHRLRAWLGWLRHVLGSPLLDGLLVGGAAALAFRGAGLIRRAVPTWAAFLDLTLVGFCLGYLLIHWLWAFPIWGRYLLPLVPMVGILLGRVVSALVSGMKSRWRDTTVSPHRRWRWVDVSALVAVVVCMALPAAGAVAGQVQVGAGWAVFDGIERVVGFLAHLPEGSVLYHHWLGWQYGFYLFDAPLYLAYWPNPAWLARDVQAFGGAEERYVVFPGWESSARVEAALAGVGYRMEPVLEVRGEEGGEQGFIVYRLLGQ